MITVVDAEISFRTHMANDPNDDTVKLVYADWLDDNDQPEPAARIRWWVDARNVMRAAVVWDRPVEWTDVNKLIGSIDPDWVRRLYTVDYARLVRGKYPLTRDWAEVNRISDDCLAVAERYALRLATDDELSTAQSAAESADDSAAWSAWSARSSAESAAAAWAAAQSAAWSARSAAQSSAWSASWSAWSAQSAAQSASWSARSSAESAWSAAQSARSAAQSAAQSTSNALIAYVNATPPPT